MPAVTPPFTRAPPASSSRHLRRIRAHPGLAHYLIHAYDYPEHARLGLPAARRYFTIAPNAPHALHMTSHIYLAAGMWDDVVAANERRSASRPSAHARPDACPAGAATPTCG